MNSPLNRRDFLILATSATAASALVGCATSGGSDWRELPLVTQGQVDPNWVHLGYGSFVVDNGTLRTECDPRGLGLLVYKKEPLGNCQVRIVFKTKDAKSNSGVYVRLAPEVFAQVGNPGPGFVRDASGTPSPESMEQVKAAAEKETGAWFGVHRGYEVQIDASGDAWHRTGAIYSLAQAQSAPAAGEWQTMIITLDGNRIDVELNGQHVSSFDPAAPNLPPRKQWHEPKREPKRPEVGYLGLQNHDPGDVVWFKQVSVRPLR